MPPVTVWVGMPIFTTELALLAVQLTWTLPVDAHVVQLPYTRGTWVLVVVVVTLLMKPAALQFKAVEGHCAVAMSLA